MKKAYVVGAIAMLIGCGGGGTPTGQVVSVTLPPGTTMHVEANIEVGVIVASTARSLANLRARADATPSPPQVFFGVPDSYVQNAPTVFALYADAFLDVPAGAAFPSPPPSVAWTQSGISIVPDIFNEDGSSNGLLSTFHGVAPRGTGKTQLIATIVGAGSAEIDIYSFHALGIACTANGLPGGTFPQGLSFNASGVAVPQSSFAASDIALMGAPCPGSFTSTSQTVSISLPNGSTQPFPTSSTQTSFVGLTASQFVNQTTSVDPNGLQVIFSSAAAAPVDKLLFKTLDGRFVKFLAVEMPRASGTNAYLTGLYGFYSVSDSNGNFSI